MIEVKVEQRTKEWFDLRMGKITGTRLKDVLKADNTPVVYDMIAEIMAQSFDQPFVNQAMQRGVDCEPIAKLAYEKLTGNIMQEVGFCLSEENDYLALSPDGFTHDRIGAIEIKCPSTKTHIKYINDNKIPSEYLPQVCMYFMVNQELEWLDFVSFDDRFKDLPIFIIRITREELEDKIVEIEDKLGKFISKFEKYYANVSRKANEFESKITMFNETIHSYVQSEVNMSDDEFELFLKEQ